jgi:hypothetical protein
MHEFHDEALQHEMGLLEGFIDDLAVTVGTLTSVAQIGPDVMKERLTAPA